MSVVIQAGIVKNFNAATDTAVALFDGTTGRLIKNSVVLVGATGAITGILSAQIGSGTLLNLTGGQVSSTDILTLTTSGTNKSIQLTPTGTGNVKVSYLTAASVVFVGGSGALAQDNTQFVFDSGNTTMAIGTNVTNYVLNSNAKATKLILANNNPSTLVSALLNVTVSDTDSLGGFVDLGHARGTNFNAMTQIFNGDVLGAFRFVGHTDSAVVGFEIGGQVQGIAEESFTSSASGSRMEFQTTPIGSVTPVTNMIIGQDGSIAFTVGPTIDASGAISGVTQLNVDNLRLDGNTLSSTSGALILNSAATGIQMSDPVEMALNTLKFGSANEAAISFDGTSIIINPKVSGTADVVIGSSSASAGNDANLRVNKMAFFGADISGTAILNCQVSGAARTAMNFILTFTGSGTVGAPLVCNFIDTSTGASMLHASTFEYTLNTTSHTSASAGAFVNSSSMINISSGTAAAIVLTNATDNRFGFTGLKLAMTGKGVGGTHTGAGVKIYNTGIFQKKTTPYVGVALEVTVGAYFGNDVCIEQDSLLIFDNTETDSTANVTITKGTTSISYVSASSLLRTKVLGTSVWDLTTTSNGCLVDLTMTDAKNIVVGSTTGTKIGTATTQKIGLWNKTPVVQPAAYTVSNNTPDRSFDCTSTTLNEIAQVLGTLILDVQSIGVVG